MKKVFLFLTALCMLSFAQAETVTRSFYFDFGMNSSTRGELTTGADVNGHYWNNIGDQGVTSNNPSLDYVYNLVDAANNATTLTLQLAGTKFTANGLSGGGGLLSVDAALLGDLAVVTATEDYLFATNNEHCSMVISGLDVNKGYQFKIFGSRKATDVRVADYTLRGQWAIQGSLQAAGENLGGTGVNQNNSSVYLSPVMKPNAEGKITLTVHKQFPKDNADNHAYFPINCMRMQEMTDLHVAEKEMYIDCGHSDDNNGELTTSPDAGGIYWNNLYENGTSAAAVNLVYSDGASVGANVTITSQFSRNGYNNGGNTADTYSTLLGAFGKKTVMGDYFFISGSTPGKMKFSGLNPDKAYVFYVIGSRAYGSSFSEPQTVDKIQLEGWTGCSFTHHTGGNGLCYSGSTKGWNEDAFSVSEPIFPTAEGELLLSLSKERGSYVHINGIRIEEYSDYVKPVPPTVLMKGTAVESSPITMNVLKINSADDATYETFCQLTNGGTLSFETDANEVLSSGSCDLETGVYRIVYSTATKTFTSLKINRVGLVGNVTNAGWNPDGDELAYQGNGVWGATLDLPVYAGTDAERGQFCMNSSWDLTVKARNGVEGIVGFTPNQADCGFSVLDINIRHGKKVVTLDMQNGTYSFECADGITDNKITFFGSSVCNGQGASEDGNIKHGYAWQLGQLLAARHSANNLPEYVYSNASINGNNTLNLLARYKGHMYGDCGEYVVIGLGLGNEGIHGAANQQAIYNQWKTNMAQLIDLAQAENKGVVATNNYPRGDYNASDYGYVKAMNLEMHEWDVPTVNFLGALDNCEGNGQWAAGYQNGDDVYHPTEAGHTEFMHAFVPSLFDALEAGKAKPTRQTGAGKTLEEGQSIVFAPEDEVHSFTLAFRVKNISALNLELGLSAGTAPELPTLPTDEDWHTLVISHYYAAGKTFIYLDNVLQGSAINGQMLLSGVSVGGACTLSDLHFWRSGMNADEIAAWHNNKMLCSSLEIYCPLNDNLNNLAQSTNSVRLAGQYFITGNCAAFGEWSPNAVEMTNKEITVNLPAEWYEFKVTDGTWDNQWGYTELDVAASSPMHKTYGDGNNICFRLQAAADVTVKMVNNKVVLLIDREYNITGNGADIAGNVWLAGHNWWSKDDDSKLDADLSRTYYNLPVGDYRFKVKENVDAAWNDDCTWGYAHLDTENSNIGGDWDGDSHNIGFHLDVPADVTISLVNNKIRVNAIRYFITGNGDGDHGDWCGGKGWWTDYPDARLEGESHTKTYASLPAGEYKFRITNGHWVSDGGTVWDHSNANFDASSFGYYTDNDANICFRLTEAAGVTVQFDKENEKIALTSTKGYFDATYYLVGATELIPTGWDAGQSTFAMTHVGEGIFRYIQENKVLTAGTYAYKLVADRRWDAGCAFPNGNGNDEHVVIPADGIYTLTYTFNPAAKTLTCAAVPVSKQITISQYSFNTFYADKAYIVPDGLQAFIYTGISGDMLEMQEIDVIPALTGVVLYGAANGNYELPATLTDVTYNDNLLKGTLADETIDNSQVHYILSLYNEQVGLYWPYNTTNGVGAFTNHAGKAYLELDPASAPLHIRGFVLRGKDTPTAIEDIAAPEAENQWFDMLGRPIEQPTQSGIYIRQGKKVVIL